MNNGWTKYDFQLSETKNSNTLEVKRTSICRASPECAHSSKWLHALKWYGDLTGFNLTLTEDTSEYLVFRFGPNLVAVSPGVPLTAPFFGTECELMQDNNCSKHVA